MNKVNNEDETLIVFLMDIENKLIIGRTVFHRYLMTGNVTG